MSTLDRFLAEYDSGDLQFNGLRFRNGAVITHPFGLDRLTGDTPELNRVRIHTGVDRARGKKGDLVFVPFDAQHTDFYCPIDGYGSLVVLVSFDYGFEVRIAHMHPDADLRHEIRDRLQAHGPLKHGAVLGKAGHLGLSAGRHTHTEIVSLEPQNLLLDDLLSRKFGEQAFREYNEAEIFDEYRQHSAWKDAPDADIQIDWIKLKQERRWRFGNRFRYRYFDGLLNRDVTRYSSALLFNGM